MNNLDTVYILNEQGNYSKWIVEEEFEKHYNISLSKDRSIISAISKKNLFELNGHYHSDQLKKIEENKTNKTQDKNTPEKRQYVKEYGKFKR